MPTFLGWFLSPLGLLLLAALDSSVVFYAPLANDIVLVYLVAAHPRQFWLYPILAAAGSVAGVGSTYWIGRLIGDDGIERWVAKSRLDRLRRKVRNSGALALAVPAIFPPPFPFTPFVLSSGALEVNPRAFLAAVAFMRLVRFFAEAVLARLYGQRLVAWMNSDIFKMAIWAFVFIAVAGTAWSVVVLVRRSGSRRARLIA